ncbi:RNA-polymerase sigma factor (nucleomorph) [Cryptomonas paramecium]|uniref:RNA-polymerase sigma factor n=1 Tax=Cryptomonas paramaecium TaxID=2898 RepID=F2HHX7_9CRYP|nr:RNA-polymerase sigma factor [Cryptomonas paramecium]AEA38923.1 RNA-polymerase sigma factor [Cryptomonas paramecium]|mmetsp:Transcript_5524/g.17709  ORF Transcript_5524/g.17709 Transcript_5524/m.17709 type:complete len:415 (-) Transcript_5524:6690-7934(-)
MLKNFLGLNNKLIFIHRVHLNFKKNWLEFNLINNVEKNFYEVKKNEVKKIIKSFNTQREFKNKIEEPEVAKFQSETKPVHKSDDSVRWYLQLIGKVKLLKPEEEIQLAREISQLLQWEHIKVFLKEKLGREPTALEWSAACKISDVQKFKTVLYNSRKAKERMIAANLRLVVSIAKRYSNRGMSLQDLVQEGSLGLIRATEKFDSEKGFKFSTYATWWIKQSVSRAIADHSRTIRLPVHLYDTLSAIKKTTRILTIELGRSPTEEEIACKMDVTVDKLRSVLQSAQPTLSLEKPIKNDGDTAQLSDFIEADQESPDEHVEKSMLRDDLRDVINSLSLRERDVIRMRYGLDDGKIRTLEEIGQIFSVTRERVRQIEAKAIRKLRQPYRSSIFKDHSYTHLNTSEKIFDQKYQSRK